MIDWDYIEEIDMVSVSPHISKKKCMSCHVDSWDELFMPSPDCGHSMCGKCFKLHARASFLRNDQPITCADNSCTAQVSNLSLRCYLPEIYDVYYMEMLALRQKPEVTDFLSEADVSR